MKLLPEEPAAGPWRAVPMSELAGTLVTGGSRPVVVAVDGRSASGKSTLADRLAAVMPGSAVVHTDDIAWNHSMFDWSAAMREGVLEPVHRGEVVRYRPPGWVAKGRPGSVEVPAQVTVLIVEGVGAGQRDLADLVDHIVWVQSDHAEAERRGLARDVASGVNGDEEQTIAFWRHWMTEEEPFLAAQRPWERASVVAAGTPPEPVGDDDVLIADPPTS